MAIYHLSVKPVQRSAGRSSTAAAAYRAGERITDERTGEIHDYRRKGGVESAELVLPASAPEWAADRATLWNAAEAAEKRKDGTPAREIVVALPAELSAEERRQLALTFAAEMADTEGCAVDVCIHAPDKDGDNRNHHAHMLRTTRKLAPDGLGEKLATEKAGRNRKADLEAIRERWAALANRALERAGHAERIDHRSHADAGIEAVPTRHHGPTVTAIERRSPGASRVVRAQEQARQAIQKAAEAAKGGDMGQEVSTLEKSLQEAKNERERQRERAAQDERHARRRAMTADELAAEVRELGYQATKAEQASRRQPDEIERQAREKLQAAEAEAAKAKAEAKAKESEIDRWKAAHRLRMAIGADGPLKALEAAYEAAEARREAADGEALRHGRTATQRADERAAAAADPYRREAAEVRELEQQQRQREKQEQQRQREQAELTQEAERRLARVLARGPDSAAWPHLPAQIRALGDRIHAELGHDPHAVSKATDRAAERIVASIGRDRANAVADKADELEEGRENARNNRLSR